MLWPAAAQVCDPQALEGAYGFQISGTTTVAGAPQPVVSVGRLDFDGEGGVSGTGSVNFAGYFLGNPVKGTYQVSADCSISWSLQSDSGAFQHFAGVIGSDLRRGAFHQTDRGGLGSGTLVKLASNCSTAALAGSYQFAISGTTIPMEAGETEQAISVSGNLSADVAGNLTIVRDGSKISAGTVEVDSDCTVQTTFRPSLDMTVNLRGVLSAEHEVLAMETDAGTAIKASFRAR